MPHAVRGVISRAKGEPVTIETIVVPDPGPGEALVQVQACGVCHTDLHYREGGINDDFPFLLGHEAAGIVEAVGDGVTDVAPGDFVDPQLAGGLRPVPGLPAGRAVVLLRHAQRHAEDDAGRRHRALPRARHRRVRREDAGGRRAVHQGRPAAAPPEAAGLLGCGVMAGLGAAINTGAVGPRRHRRRHRLRRRRLRGDRRRPARRRAARSSPSTSTTASSSWPASFGATHTVNSAQADPVEAIQGAHRRLRRRRRHRGGRPAARPTSRPSTPATSPAPSCWSACRPRTCARAAADRRLRPRRGAEVLLVRRLPALARLPDADRPVPAGPADLDAFVSETIGLDDVEAAFDKMHRGEVLRSVVVL